MSDAPYQVKRFAPYKSGYEALAEHQRRTDFEETMNAWFETLAQDDAYNYDIQQILPLRDGSILVFFAKTPVETTVFANYTLTLKTL